MQKIAILTPTRDGLVDINYTNSLLATQKLLAGEWEVEPTLVSGTSDITSARNTLFNLWYYTTDVDVVMFIDSDVSWNPRDLKRWLDKGYYQCSGNYPKKAFTPEAFLRAAHLLQQQEGEIDIKKALRASWDYISTGRHNVIASGDYEGLMTTEGVGMGFFMMHRDAADILMDWAEANMTKTVFYTLNEEKPAEGYAVFNHVQDEEGKNYGEDFSFCRRMTEAGLTILLDPKVTLRHTGNVAFDGEFQCLVDVMKLAKESGSPELGNNFLTAEPPAKA